MHPALLIPLIGVLYILGFSALSFIRRQGPSVQFIAEGIGLIIFFSVLSAAVIPVSPFIFFISLYLFTMRVRLLIDLGNWFSSRKRYGRALDLFHLALRLRPDTAGRQIALINRGVTQLRMQEPEAAYFTLRGVLVEGNVQPGAKYQAAGYYNLGLACRRTGREGEAVQHFNEAIAVLPNSIYAYAATQALKREGPDKP